MAVNCPYVNPLSLTELLFWGKSSFKTQVFFTNREYNSGIVKTFKGDVLIGLGKHHPDLLAAKANLANMLCRMGDFEGARALAQELRNRAEAGRLAQPRRPPSQ